jgi:hypothetical protein
MNKNFRLHNTVQNNLGGSISHIIDTYACSRVLNFPLCLLMNKSQGSWLGIHSIILTNNQENKCTGELVYEV